MSAQSWPVGKVQVYKRLQRHSIHSKTAKGKSGKKAGKADAMQAAMAGGVAKVPVPNKCALVPLVQGFHQCNDIEWLCYQKTCMSGLK